MLFNSYVFIFCFLPLSLLSYFGLNRFGHHLAAKTVLVLMSLYFYAFFNVSYLPIIVVSLVVNYLLCKGIDRLTPVRGAGTGDKGVRMRRRVVFIAAMLFNLAVIGYFKYYDFFISNINAAFGTDYTLKHLILPLGISFYTFQQIALIVDIYRRDLPCTPPLVDYCMYITFFPQLIAGPIVLANETIPQFAEDRRRIMRYKNLFSGLHIFAVGLAKKVIIADTVALFANAGFDSYFPYYTFKEAWFVSISYTLQIYFDFSGYCDMALGIARMFNIDLPENFNKPYLATSFRDFWHRWHITLNRFFTQYVYIPLGGSRKGEARAHGNTMVVFGLSGLWHGAGWTFILWGLLHGIGVCFNRLWRKIVGIRVPRFVSIVLTFVLVNVLWVLFRAESLDKAMALYRGMFLNTDFYFREEFLKGFWGTPVATEINLGILVAAFVAAFVAPKAVNTARVKSKLLLCIFTIVLLTVSVFFLTQESPFLYFNF